MDAAGSAEKMPRGRKPKPTYLKLLQGNPGCRPINQNEPQPSRPQPTPPEHLSADARVEWDRMVEEVYNLGLLTVVDVMGFAAYCQAYGRWVVAERMLARVAALDPQSNGLLIRSANGNPIPNPLIWVASNALRDMVRYAAEFGFTPAARTRIAVAAQSPESSSKFAGLLG